MIGKCMLLTMMVTSFMQYVLLTHLLLYLSLIKRYANVCYSQKNRYDAVGTSCTYNCSAINLLRNDRQMYVINNDVCIIDSTRRVHTIALLSNFEGLISKCMLLTATLTACICYVMSIHLLIYQSSKDR